MKNNLEKELKILQEQLAKATYKYTYGKNVIEQNKANYEMLSIEYKIKKIRDEINNSNFIEYNIPVGYTIDLDKTNSEKIILKKI